MATEFFKFGTHRCIRFDNVTDDGDVQANQCLIIDNDRGLLLDPDGNRIYTKMIAALPGCLPMQKLDKMILSHPDPDVGAGLNVYLLLSDAKICYSVIWERFIPSFCTKGWTANRVWTIPNEGMRLKRGATDLLLFPAHFLDSPGNSEVYDPISKTLFSGDLGTSLLPSDALLTVTDWDSHLKYMEGFHPAI